MDINVTELRRLGKKGHGLKFGRKKIKSVGGREGFRRSSRLLGSCASGPSTPRRPSTPRLPIMLLAAGVLECPDILNQVLSLLGPLDLARCAAVCRQWNSEAHAATLWKPLCEKLWTDKVHVPARQQSAAGSVTFCRAYPQSLQDSTRNAITTMELCSFSWQFRFKEAAGAFYVLHDPWHSGQGPPMKRRFHSDGSITSAGPDALFGGHENRWRITRTKHGVKGHFTKINHWPALELSRTANWGWRMENCWVAYDSHP